MANTAFAEIAVTGAATGTSIVAAPAAGLAIRIIRIHLTVASAAATVSVFGDTDVAATRYVYGDFAIGGWVVLDSYGSRSEIRPVAILPAAKALKITNSAGNVKGVVEYDIV